MAPSTVPRLYHSTALLLPDAGSARVLGRDVVAVTPDADLLTLERALIREGIGRLPVVEDGVLTGIVTRKDLLRAEHGDAFEPLGVIHRFLRSAALRTCWTRDNSEANVATIIRPFVC